MNRRNWLLNLPVVGFVACVLGFKATEPEPFAWVLATTYKDGTITEPSYSILYVERAHYWDNSNGLTPRISALEYTQRLKKHVEDLRGTNTGWHGNGWDLVKQEIFPLYR
jgi:hypothetical protein